MPKTSVPVAGEREAVLIDGQFTLPEQCQMLADVLTSGKRLTTVFVSAADPDYYFGLQVIREEFPDVDVVCTPATLEKIEATWESKLQTWAHPGPDLASEVVIPELLGSDRFELEGHVFEVRGGHPDLAWRTEYVWQAEGRAVLGGAMLWSGLHAWTADTPTTVERAVWDQVLDEVEELDPRLVVAGHAAEGAPTDASVVSSTRAYLAVFEKEPAGAGDAQALQAAMLRRYPDLGPSEDRRERAAAVPALVAWAQDTSDLLTDPDPAIRAALAPLPADDPRPTAILLDALSDPHAADHWFDPEAPRCEPSLFRPGVDSRGRAAVRSGIGGSRRRGSCWLSGRTAYRQPPFRRTMSALRVVAQAHHAA
ncbi:MBL fold metallo-hydrolase [Streptomyces erythrochromogenes]|uniref:MBL fold metallo-hydrolase n=1 Tax=Streptomyces erythrochromogenes TaxID=285574 RepID=UPI00382C2B94